MFHLPSVLWADPVGLVNPTLGPAGQRLNVPRPAHGARTSALTTAALIASMTHEYAQTGIIMRQENALLSALCG